MPNTSLLDVFRIVGIFSTGISIFINILVLNFFIKNIKYSFLIISSIFVISFFFGDNLIFLMTNYPYYPKQFFKYNFYTNINLYLFYLRIYEKKLFPIFLTLILISFINQSSIHLIIAGMMIFVFLIIEIKWEIVKIKNNKHINSINFNYILFYFYLEFYFTPTGVISNYSNNLSINASVKGPYYGQIIEIFKNYYIYSPSKFFSGLNYFYLLLFVFTISLFKIIFKKKLLFYHYVMLIITFLLVFFNPISIFILNELMPINFLIRLNKFF